MAESSIQTFCGDCLEVMDSIDDSSVDMILCDLPYGSTFNNWDSVIPLDRLWDAYHRVIKEGGAIVLFAQPPFSYILGTSNIQEFRYQWVWKKDNSTGFLSANKMPLRIYEEILVFCDKGCPYHPQFTLNRNRVTGSDGGNTNCWDVKTIQHSNIPAIGRYPTNLLEFSTERGKDNHPTQKPVALCEYLIRTYTDEGMTVMDNCMGSGTTGVACIQTGRAFVGIEKDPQYYSKAIERIQGAEYRARTRSTLDMFAEVSE